MTSTSSTTAIAPELRALLLPRSIGVRGRTSLAVLRWVTALGTARAADPRASIERLTESVSVRVSRPMAAKGLPAVLHMHGGGLVLGSAVLGDALCRLISDQLGALCASVEYRLAPEHPFPVPLEDCYTALQWLASHPDVDGRRIVLVGESAGGGLAAALAIMARDRAEIHVSGQVLTYPMLSHTTTEPAFDRHLLRLWGPKDNAFAWRSYLRGIAEDHVPMLASPAQCTNLEGLPPTWIGIGDCDLFHKEAVAFGERLDRAGVPCTISIVPGAYHGFDYAKSHTRIAREFHESRMTALARLLGGGQPE